jgi:protein SCO1/2
MPEVDRAMRRLLVPLIVAGLLAGALGFLASQRVAGSGQHGPAEMYASLTEHGKPLPKLWRAPDFTYEDQAGKSTTRETFHGHPWIVDFIFTQCSSACPMMTSRMVLLQRGLAGAHLSFVSFSVDPEHDTPAVLADYARQWNPQETRWTLLSTTPAQLRKTVEGFAVTVEPGTDPANRIVHSSIFELVDSDGWVRGVYDSNDSDARARLALDARSLAGEEMPSAPSAQPVGLSSSLGCAGCHAHPNLAPPLEGLFGRKVSLQNGQTVTADEDYLRRSILEPGAQIVAGYLPLMPSYAGEISDAQVGALINEIKRSAGAPRHEETTSAALVNDPVCHMKVRASPEAPHATYAGHDYYFCSDDCRREFVARPKSFTGEKAGEH